MSRKTKLLSEVPVYDSIPAGYSEIKGATTAPNGYMWVSNNKSHFGGERKQALVKLQNKLPGGETQRSKVMAQKQSYSAQDKCDYYSKRVNNPKLSEKQRAYAAKRLNALCGGKGSASGKATVAAPSRSTNNSKYTDAQKEAYTAGRVYGMAKAGKRVPVKDENKDSFRAGVNRERGKKKPRAMF